MSRGYNLELVTKYEERVTGISIHVKPEYTVQDI